MIVNIVKPREGIRAAAVGYYYEFFEMGTPHISD
jgi:hypothetical protein